MGIDEALHLLFVEDHQDDVDLSSQLLRHQGFSFEVRRVATEEDLVAALDRFEPDVVISEHLLPQLDGMRALRLCRGKGSTAPFVVLTGSGSEEVAVGYLKAGAADYLPKAQRERLPAAVKEVLEKPDCAGEGETTERVRQALRESEEKFSRAFQAAPVSLLISTLRDGEILDANELACTTLGRNRDDLIGRTTSELGLWAMLGNREEALEKLRRDGHVRGLEALLDVGGGDLRSMIISMEPVELNGEPCLISSALDITKQVRVQREIADALQTNRTILENCPMGVISFKASGPVASVNETAARILGGTVSQIMRQNYHHLRSWKSGLLDAAEEALSSGRTVTREVELTTTFGVHLWAKATFSNFELGGEPHLMLMLDDLSARKHAEAAKQESEERFKALVDAAPDGIVIHSDGIIHFVNPAMAELLGFDRPEDLVGRPVMSTIAPESRDLVADSLRVQRETGEQTPAMEEELLRSDGSRVSVEATAVLFPMRGEIARLVFIRDLTERRKAAEEREALQEQLQQAQKMESVGLLAGGVAHDFNNILMVQKGYCELMRSDLELEGPVIDGLTQIEACADRAAGLTRQLLAFSRRQVMQPVVLDVNVLVEDMEDMLSRVVGEGVELDVRLPSRPSLVKADPLQLEQVFTNLAANARDAMPEGGTLRIELAAVNVDDSDPVCRLGVTPGPNVMIAVGDTGHGMDADVRRRVFDPFFTTKAEGKGTGLGLSTVYGIVKQSGGTIWVESEPGQGATFRIALPGVRGEVEAGPEPAEALRHAGKGEPILVVEDEPALRSLVQLMVESLGYTVAVAANGAEAKSLIQDKGLRPALLLTDVVMPGMSGAALVEDIRRTIPDLKFIFMSGYPDSAIARHRIAEATFTFLPKPFSIRDLASIIESVLAPAAATSNHAEV